MTSADDFVLQLLQDRALVTSEDVATAREQVEAQEDSSGNPDTEALDLLIQKGYVTPQQIVEAMADEFSMEVVDLNDIRVSHEALEKVDRQMASRYKVFPIEVDGSQL
ncbi:MAG: type II/IV secretion system protein, partial [Puniceicoccales bacterium]